MCVWLNSEMPRWERNGGSWASKRLAWPGGPSFPEAARTSKRLASGCGCFGARRLESCSRLPVGMSVWTSAGLCNSVLWAFPVVSSRRVVACQRAGRASRVAAELKMSVYRTEYMKKANTDISEEQRLLVGRWRNPSCEDPSTQITNYCLTQSSRHSHYQTVQWK